MSASAPSEFGRSSPEAPLVDFSQGAGSGDPGPFRAPAGGVHGQTSPSWSFSSNSKNCAAIGQKRRVFNRFVNLDGTFDKIEYSQYNSKSTRNSTDERTDLRDLKTGMITGNENENISQLSLAESKKYFHPKLVASNVVEHYLLNPFRKDYDSNPYNSADNVEFGNNSEDFNSEDFISKDFNSGDFNSEEQIRSVNDESTYNLKKYDRFQEHFPEFQLYVKPCYGLAGFICEKDITGKDGT